MIQRAFLIALMVGPVAALLGVFITLRSMSFFSDAISHGAMAGVAVGLLLRLAPGVNSPAMSLVLIAWCVFTAVVLVRIMEVTTLRADTVLAVCVTGSVALARILIPKLDKRASSLDTALFGDILATTTQDVWIVFALCVAIALFLLFNMRALALSTIHEHLATLEGIRIRRINYLFVFLLAVTVAVLLKQLGAMLVSGLIVIPAAASRSISKSFFVMLVLAGIFGLVAGLSGVLASCMFDDVPTGPAMVIANLVILAVCFLIGLLASRKIKQIAESA